MRMYGVPKGGKRVKLADGLSLHIPFGVAYGKDEDGNFNIVQFQSIPAGYRSGAFTVEDEEERLWSINGLKKTAVIDFTSEDTELTPEAVQGAMREKICDLAKSMVQEDNSTDEPYEWGSSTKVEETEGGFVMRSGISINAAGGSYQILGLSGKLAGAVAKKGFQLFGITMYFNYLFLAVEDCPSAPVFYATLGAPDDPDFYEKTLVPLLETAEFEGKKGPAAAKKQPIQRDAGPVVESLDFSQGERVRTGEFSILVPGGMCWSPDISPESRYLSSVPASVTFDNPDWDEVSAIKFTVQTGQKIPAIQNALNTAAGEKEIQNLLKNTRVQQQGVSQGGIGKVVTLAREPEYYICYELAQEDEIDCVFRYYLFSRTFVYIGMYIGWKAGLQDPVQRHTDILKQLLGAVQYEGGAEKEQARFGKTQFGDYAAEDGRLNAVTVAQLFSGDVLFFNEDDFKENGLKNGIHLNALKLAEHPLLQEKRDVLAPEIVSLLLELDAVPELRISKEKLHKKLIPLLFNDHDEPLTGMTMMNLLAYHMLFIQENQKDDYTVAIDRNLVAGIPDAYHYAARFLRQLRLYNGKDGAFTVTFATAANFDSPIQGALKPVEGAAQTKSAYRIQVEPDGGIQELEGAEIEEQPAAERSISELEQLLPGEFTTRMRAFSADIASRLPKVCKVLETSSYDDLTNTDDVLSRVMSQTGDYGLEWGIFNFYNVFAMGDRDNTFSFEKDGEKDFSDPDGPSYRIDEQYEEYADGDPDFRPDEFPKQLAERIRGITEEEIYRELLEQAVEAQNKGYTIVDQEKIRLEKQKEGLKKVPFDRVTSVAVAGSAFVLTGEFEHCGNDREAIKGKIQAKGGRVTGAISGKTNYLVIGSYGGFGERKLEQVKEQRAKGKDLKIIREEDLFAALEGKPTKSAAPQSADKPKKTAAPAPKAAEKKPGKKSAERPQGKRVSLMGNLSILLPKGGTCQKEKDGSYFFSIPIKLPGGNEDVWNITNFEKLNSIEGAFEDTEDSGNWDGTALTELLQSIVSKMTAAEKRDGEDEMAVHMDQVGEDTYHVSLSMSNSIAGGAVKTLKLSGQKGAVAVEKLTTLNGEGLKVARLFVTMANGRDCELYMGVVFPPELEGDAFYHDHLAPLLDTLEVTAPKPQKKAPAEKNNAAWVQQAAAQEKRKAEEVHRAEEKRKAEEKRQAEEKHKAEEKRKAEAKRKADERRREEERRKAEETRRKAEEAQKAAEEKALQLAEQRVRNVKLLRKLAIAAVVIVVLLAVAAGVRNYMEDAPYRELSQRIDEGKFNYVDFVETQSEYFMVYDDTCKVIASKLTDFHKADDIQGAVQLLANLPPDESIIDYYISSRNDFSLSFEFRDWFLERVEEKGTKINIPNAEQYTQDDGKSKVLGLYQLGDYYVLVYYNWFLEDDDCPEVAYIIKDDETDSRVYLGTPSRYPEKGSFVIG